MAWRTPCQIGHGGARRHDEGGDDGRRCLPEGAGRLPFAGSPAFERKGFASWLGERPVRSDMVARGGMMKAAMMGAVAFQKGLGACHSLAHPLSSEKGLHHGLANALCLAAVEIGR